MSFITLNYKSLQLHTSAIVILALTLVLISCGAGIYKDHPMLQFDEDTLTANVYFIRPQPVKRKGIADNPIKVNYQNLPLLEISEGTYTMLQLKPSSGNVTTLSRTRFINKMQYDVIDVTRSRLYKFVAGRTYFIHLNRLDEEFRGIFYDPQPVDLATAKVLTDDLRASGLARSSRIEDIETVPTIPTPNPLEPAYPEDLYPKSPYLLDKPEKR